VAAHYYTPVDGNIYAPVNQLIYPQDFSLNDVFLMISVRFFWCLILSIMV